MNIRQAVTVNNRPSATNAISWLFGTLFFAIGLVNIFFGNDALFGVFILLLSLLYFLPVNDLLRRTVGFSIPKLGIIKILVGIFILWASLGVGELFDKIQMMKTALS